MGIRHLLVDLGPLKRYPQFRRLWLGYLVSSLGSQLTVVGVPYEIYRLTHSSLDVGLVGMAQLVPLLLCSMLGGYVADTFDRRKLLIITEVSLGITSVGLALDASQRHPALWLFYVISAAAAGLSAIDSPTRTATVANLVDRADYTTSSALWQVLYQVGSVAGPGVGGLLLGHFGVASVFWIDALTFAAALASVLSLEPIAPAHQRGPVRISDFTQGLTYLRGRQQLQGNFVIDLAAMIFGLPRALFPAIGLVFLHGNASTVGYLYAAPGAGALIAAVLTGWVSKIRRQGMAVIWSVTLWGLAITAFGFSRQLWLSLVLLALAGAADVISAVFRGTILQLAIPDSLRGRLMAIHMAVVTGGPRLGDAEAGAVADLAGTEFSVVSGGLACLVGVALIAWRMPVFRKFDAQRAVAESTEEAPVASPA